jgi:hypothetical protein
LGTRTCLKTLSYMMQSQHHAKIWCTIREGTQMHDEGGGLQKQSMQYTLLTHLQCTNHMNHYYFVPFTLFLVQAQFRHLHLDSIKQCYIESNFYFFWWKFEASWGPEKPSYFYFLAMNHHHHHHHLNNFHYSHNKQGITNTLALPIDKMLYIYLLWPHFEHQKQSRSKSKQSKTLSQNKRVHKMWNWF